jgi:hypothetical protein
MVVVIPLMRRPLGRPFYGIEVVRNPYTLHLEERGAYATTDV